MKNLLLKSLGYKPRTGAVIVYSVCQKEKYLRPSHIKRSSTSFCGSDCASRAQLRGKNYSCTICNEVFYRNPAQVKYRGEPKYCSKKCKGVSMSRMALEQWPGKKTKHRPPIARLKKKLWKVFAIYIKRRDGYKCFTCGAKVEGSNAHAGHFVPKSVGGMALYFNEENVHCQCMRCNVHLGGSQYIYGQRLGKKKAEQLYALKGKVVKWTEEDYLQKIAHYEASV